MTEQFQNLPPNLTNLINVMVNNTKVLNAINDTLSRVLPVSTGVSATATAGGAVLPATPEGFLDATHPVTGIAIKIPFYLP